jgi:hypothetical protein
MTVITATSRGRHGGNGRGMTQRWQYRTVLESGGQSTPVSPYRRPFRKAVRVDPSLIVAPMGLKLSEGNANGISWFKTGE